MPEAIPDQESPKPPALPSNFKPWGTDLRTFAMLMHLAQFLGGLGVILIIVMWATNKEQSAFIDNQGRAILRWHLTLVICFFSCAVLCFMCLACIAIPMVVGLVICSVVFAILGAIKANEGKVWKYPLSIPFFAVDTTVTA